MPTAKTDETDSRPAADAVASAGTTPGDLAHEIALLGAALRLTPEQRAARPACRPPLSPRGPPATADRPSVHASADPRVRCALRLSLNPDQIALLNDNNWPQGDG